MVIKILKEILHMEFLETLLADLGVTDIIAGLEPTMIFPIMMAVVIVGFIVATCASRLLTYAFKIAGTAAFGVIGWFVGDMVLANVELELEGIALASVIGFIFALIGLRIGGKHPKFMTFVIGAGIGYIVGSSVVATLASEVEFLASDIAQIIVPIVCAIIVALLCVWLFKFIYILATSMGGMIVAGYAFGVAVAPEFALYCAIAGVVAGIFAMVHQYKKADF